MLFSKFESNEAEEEDSEEKILEQFTEEELKDIRKMKSNPQIYEQLVNSIAPTVFGSFPIFHFL